MLEYLSFQPFVSPFSSVTYYLGIYSLLVKTSEKDHCWPNDCFGDLH